MAKKTEIREHTPVIGACGTQLGTVDRVEENEIKLARNDANANGQHHWIPMSWVASADENNVRLTRSCDDAMREWRGETTGASGRM